MKPPKTLSVIHSKEKTFFKVLFCKFSPELCEKEWRWLVIENLKSFFE